VGPLINLLVDGMQVEVAQPPELVRDFERSLDRVAEGNLIQEQVASFL
jgi:hypothetical protein